LIALHSHASSYVTNLLNGEAFRNEVYKFFLFLRSYFFLGNPIYFNEFMFVAGWTYHSIYLENLKLWKVCILFSKKFSKMVFSEWSEMVTSKFNNPISYSWVNEVKFWGQVNKFLPAYACRHSSVREISMMILMAYLSYMLAEVLDAHLICYDISYNKLFS
jgi:hypothetical protein